MRILSTKKILVSGLAALSLVLAGCLTEDSEDSAPLITVHPQSQTKMVGDTLQLSITATGSGTLSYKWVLTANGMSDTLTFLTSTIKVAVDVGLDGATLKCIVSNAIGQVISTPATVTVTGDAWPASDTLTLGAQGAGPGSALDLDSGKVWQSSVANANLAKIDLVYLYLPAGGSDSVATLLGARAARDSGFKYGINLTNGYDTLLVKSILLVEVNAKPASQQHAAYAYTTGTKVAASAIAAGDKFVVKTSENKYVYVEVTSVVTGKAGTSKLTLSLSTL